MVDEVDGAAAAGDGVEAAAEAEEGFVGAEGDGVEDGGAGGVGGAGGGDDVRGEEVGEARGEEGVSGTGVGCVGLDAEGRALDGDVDAGRGEMQG